MAVLTLPVSRLCHVEAPCQICENLTNGSRVIQDFANFNMAAGGHLGLCISTFWDHRLVPGTKWMINTKFGAYRTNRFEDIQFLVNSQFFVGGHLGF